MYVRLTSVPKETIQMNFNFPTREFVPIYFSTQVQHIWLVHGWNISILWTRFCVAGSSAFSQFTISLLFRFWMQQETMTVPLRPCAMMYTGMPECHCNTQVTVYYSYPICVYNTNIFLQETVSEECQIGQNWMQDDKWRTILWWHSDSSEQHTAESNFNNWRFRLPFFIKLGKTWVKCIIIKQLTTYGMHT